jgi:N-methylhydantoinase A
MGGTSTDVSLIDGVPQQQTEWEIGGFPVKVPAVDIHTVGAGGGSLAAIDAGGVLKVGPQSAGAVPGPACYGRGERATVTDADLVLGRLAPDAFLGGRMVLDTIRARRAVGAIAKAIGLSAEAAAEGIVRVVDAGMERAIRRVSIERGHDPRAYTLVAFGGAAGMHACSLADGLGIARVLVPNQPGLLSAHGAVSADVRRDYVQTIRLRDPHPADLSRRLATLLRRARRELQREVVGPTRTGLESFLDCRYPGQSYEISIPMRTGFANAFHQAHRRRYGYADPARGVEVVNLRVAATATATKPRAARGARRAGVSEPHRLRWNGRWLNARRIAREALPIGKPLKGPLLVTELSATTLVPPSWTALVLRTGDLILHARRKARL